MCYRQPEPLISVMQAAQMLEITPQAVNHRLKTKTLPGTKVGNTWVIPLASVIASSLESK